MDIKEAKSFIQAGFAFAGWSDEQKEAFQVAWDCMTKVQQKELKSEGLIELLNQHYRVLLYHNLEEWHLQLSDKETDTRLFDDFHENLETLLTQAFSWMKRNRELI